MSWKACAPMPLLSKASVSPEVALRALAISLVTFNHSQQLALPFGFGGGMAFLLMLSGLNFARFALDGRTAKETRDSAFRLAVSIAIPTTLVVLGSFLISGGFDWRELLFVSNIFDRHGIAMMHLWYPHMIVQLLLGLGLVFSIPPLGRLILKRPWITSAVIFMVAVGLRMLDPPGHTQHAYPHLHLWNFALGWLVYFTLTRPVIRGWWSKRLLLLACTAAGAFVGLSYNQSNPYFLTLCTAALLLLPAIPAPAFAARIFNLVSQATFTIFLLHMAFIALYDAFFAQDTIAKFAFSMTLSVLCWVIGAAIVRAYAQRQAAGQPA